MNATVTKLSKSEVELRIALEPNEIKKDIENAAKRISETVKIPGFRPGHAPYEIVRAKVGEMKIWEEALETIIKRTYRQALEENAVETVGQPYFSVETLAPGNPLVYKVKTAVLPKIIKLADYKSLKVSKKAIEVTPQNVDDALKQLARMQTKEVEVDRPARGEDKVSVDMNMYLDKVALEGGQAKNHGIYLAESYYIPGLNEKLVGIKKGETREFDLEFPKEHYQKNVAGKIVNFKITANSVFELSHPPMDDAFAQSLGQKTTDELRAIIKKNLEDEAAAKETQREEIEMLEKIADGSSFEDIPDVLINAETERMVHELENSISAQGIEWNKYLAGVGKTVPQLKLDFSPRALHRIKISLIIREVAKKEGIEADDKEVAAEIARAMNQYKDNADAQKIIRSDEYQEEARTVSRNKKTIEFLRNLIAR